MIKFENTEVFNFKAALRGMRNPLNSWDKSDSEFYNDEDPDDSEYLKIGRNDLDLAQRLIKAGSDHRKFLRQIFVSVDITAPLYWWKEYSTYKVATVENSCSTMHKIHSKPIELSDFSFEDFNFDYCDEMNLKDMFADVVHDCETLRRAYLAYDKKSKNTEFTESERKHFRSVAKHFWRGLIQLLPESYNQKRTVTLNYETLRNIYGSRRNHKLDEWSVGFMDWIKTLPYAEELIIT